VNIDLNKMMSESFACIADISSGRHNNGERGTSELSAYVLGPLAEAMRDLDWDSPQSFSITVAKVKDLFAKYPDVLGSYPTLRALALNEETQFQ
jgi:hypothetical protein